jgi:hypothetical protein
MSQYAPFLLPLLLLYGFLVAAFLIAFALSRTSGHRIGALLVVPVVGALLLAVGLAVAAPQEAAALPGTVLRGGLVAGGIYGLAPIWTVPLALGAAVAALVTAHYAVVVLPAAAGWVGARASGARQRSARAADIARVLILLIVGGATIGGTLYTKAAITPISGLVEVTASFELAGSPTSIAVVDELAGYIAYGEGSIVRFEIDEELGGLNVEEVASGLTFPRGLAVTDGRLFVIDLGELPCERPFPQCWFEDPVDELELLQSSAASVLAYQILEDGSLGEPSNVIDDLPVVSTEHAPNAIEVGADGMLYLSVGNVDRLPLAPDLLDGVDHARSDMLGTVVRFDPDGRDVSVFARGIRNIYELESDPGGRLYGVDNDGPALRGWRPEQLVELREGVDWGFPADGSPPSDGTRDTIPIWNLHISGSAGLAWADNVGGRSGLLIGGLTNIVFVGISGDDEGAFVEDETAVAVAIEGLQGFVPTIEPIGDGRLVAGVFAPFAGYRNALLVLSPTP